MSISFESALGIHEKALSFRAQRAEVLANNIANADTPYYQARDLDFAAGRIQQLRNDARGLPHSKIHSVIVATPAPDVPLPPVPRVRIGPDVVLNTPDRVLGFSGHRPPVTR